jgi:hypothetical protein
MTASEFFYQLQTRRIAVRSSPVELVLVCYWRTQWNDLTFRLYDGRFPFGFPSVEQARAKSRGGVPNSARAPFRLGIGVPACI